MLKEGEELEVKIVNMDRKNRTIGLSIKAKDVEEERQAVREHQKQESDRGRPCNLGRSDQGSDEQAGRRLGSAGESDFLT